MAAHADTSHTGMSFVTMVTHQRRPIFQIARIAETFIQVLLDLRMRGHFKLHAFLVMPDHVHLLLTPRSQTLDDLVRLIQRAFTQRVDSRHILWEERSTAHPVRSMRSLETLRSYLHQTPVRANLATTPELYPYSSAHRLEHKIAPLPTTTSLSQPAS